METHLASTIKPPVTHPVSGHAPAMSRGPVLSTAQRGAGAIEAAKPQLSKAEKRAERYEKLSHVTDRLYTFEMGAMLMTPLAWVASKASNRLAGAMRMIQAIPRALNRTSIDEIGGFRANVLDVAREKAIESGGKVNTSWTPVIERTQARVASKDAGRVRAVSEATRSTRTRVGARINRMGEHRVGKALLSPVKWLVEKRHAKLDASMGGRLEGIVSNAQGLGQKTWYARESAALMEEAPKLTSKLEAAHKLQGAARMDHLHHVGEHIESVIKTKGLTGREAKALYAVKEEIGHLGKAANTLKGYAAALHPEHGGKATDMLKSLGRMVSGRSLFQLGVGVGAFAVVKMVQAKHEHENNVETKALNDLRNYAGEHSMLVVDAASKQGKQKWGRAGETMATAATQVANVAFAAPAMHGVGFVQQMLVMSTLPMLGQIFVAENPFLNSMVNLQKAEKGEVPMTPAEKVEHIRNLVALVRVVKQPGHAPEQVGYYNNLAGPVAKELADKNMSTAELLKLLGDKDRFAEVVIETKAKQPEAKAATPTQAHSTAEHRYAQQEKPAIKGVQAHASEAHGRVSDKAQVLEAANDR